MLLLKEEASLLLLLLLLLLQLLQLPLHSGLPADLMGQASAGPGDPSRDRIL